MKRATIEVFGPADPPPTKGEPIVACVSVGGDEKWVCGNYAVWSARVLDGGGEGFWRWDRVLRWHRPVPAGGAA